MSAKRKPWNKTKVKRVLESLLVGGYGAQRTRWGWVVTVSGEGASLFQSYYLVPHHVLRSRCEWWLGHRLIRALRPAVESFEGAQLIDGREAMRLVRWCTRWTRRRAPLTPEERAGAAKIGRFLRKEQRFPQTIHGAGYLAERSRRGWVVMSALT